MHEENNESQHEVDCKKTWSPSPSTYHKTPVDVSLNLTITMKHWAVQTAIWHHCLKMDLFLKLTTSQLSLTINHFAILCDKNRLTLLSCYRCKWRMLQAIFQLLKSENLLRWSFFSSSLFLPSCPPKVPTLYWGVLKIMPL